MLAYLISTGRSGADRILFDTADRLRADGWVLAGAVQVNEEADPLARCEMDLHVLDAGRVVRISQSLGALSQGCRLDPAAMAEAVATAEAALARVIADPAPRKLCLVNKFGKSEVEGRGFRPMIAEALAAGIPVLTSVAPGHHKDFDAFLGGMGEELPADLQAVLAWCRAQG